jgi:hypothetical protein
VVDEEEAELSGLRRNTLGFVRENFKEPPEQAVNKFKTGFGLSHNNPDRLCRLM